MIRNQVAPTYHGALFVVEDVWVRCDLCKAAVDPVVRIPVGKQWFHPQCLRCAVCARPSKTDAFRSVKGQPVCSDCFQRGFDKALGNNGVGARGSSNLPPPPSRGTSRAGGSRPAITNGTLTPRQILSPIGTSTPATPLRITGPGQYSASVGPSPTVRFPSTPFLDSRAITKRQSELLERQRLLTEGDSNILLAESPAPQSASSRAASRLQTPAAILPPPSTTRSPISAIAYKHKGGY